MVIRAIAVRLLEDAQRRPEQKGLGKVLADYYWKSRPEFPICATEDIAFQWRRTPF